MQPDLKPNFWSYFISLFSGIPPEVGQFVASMVGGAVGLIFFPPTSWRGGLSQIFVSWAFSHYFSLNVQTNYLTKWSIEALRVAMAFSAWAIVTAAAWILKKIKGDPMKAARFLRKFADLLDDKDNQP